ncbi:putative histone deacetylase complex subunit [Ascoidea rubescens DSM 1968]|uniref:Putative histone deacetylase complex subunit n=1 Tax=Ascoidea rubescens DSM 1968 TaxID=1344418 RepID=A0A1D2VQ24_9ASCO|nr:putative histone deacetylase complex subunit [Ascoidea rubescens DSM 1968]ODV63720.1 putative histone deacetylase complex subunit [Ascoidea rubescens DSM 1968]
MARNNRETSVISDYEKSPNLNPNSINNNSGSNKTSAKARNAAALQAQKEYLARHINSNGPKDKKTPHALDFESYPIESLRKYRLKYNLDVPTAMSISGFMLGSEIGKKTYTARHQDRISKKELASAVKKDFLSKNTKESEIITNFIYTIKNERKAFKLDFGNASSFSTD